MNGSAAASRLAMLVATWFGCGLLPRAPGTWGSLAALGCAALLVALGGTILLVTALLVLLPLGTWAAGRYADGRGIKDPGAVVVDEVSGQWLALLVLPLEPVAYLLAFALFRLFDIFKLWPASWIERNMSGATAIMADDLVAGLYAAALSFLLLRVTGL